jgi:tetratricopeptide (TPR) repeat protein
MNLFNALRADGEETQAKIELAIASKAFEKLVHDFPGMMQFQNGLARVLGEYGLIAAQAGNLTDALAYYKREEAIRNEYRDSGGGDGTPPIDEIANCLTNQADVFCRMGEFLKAKEVCERSIALRTPLYEADRRHQVVCAHLAETYFRLGQTKNGLKDQLGAAGAWRRALALYDELNSLRGEYVFFRTCCHAQLSALGGKPKSGVTAEEGKAQLELAMKWLGKSVELYKVPDAYRTESGLDPIRHLPQYQQAMDELSKSTKAKK